MPWNCHTWTWFWPITSLVDILVLQRVFHRKIPFLKILSKKELFWFPFLGQAWWAWIFRSSSDIRKQNFRKAPPAGKDLAITRRLRKVPTYSDFGHEFCRGNTLHAPDNTTSSSRPTPSAQPEGRWHRSVLHAMGDRIHRILDAPSCIPAECTVSGRFYAATSVRFKVRVRSLPVDPS